MQATKFWIVEYVDVCAPKVERSELCLSKAEALRKAMKRESFIHFSDVASYAGWGLCDSQQISTTFYNQK